MTALLATYADIKTVKTRGVYQLVFEGPIEKMGEAIALLGAPVPSAEVWVGIARLDPKKLQAEADKPDPPLIERRRSYAQQAGILCNEGGFQRWLDTNSPDDAAIALRARLKVASRSDLDKDEEAAKRFLDLRADYRVWLADMEPA